MVALAAAPVAAHAQDYEVRHDRKLEKMIVATVAGKVGDIRGGLPSEWREPTAIDVIASLSALEVSLLAMRIDVQPVAAVETSFEHPKDRATLVAVTNPPPDDEVRAILAAMGG